MDATPFIASIAAAATVASSGLATWLSSLWSTRAEMKERDRLTSEVLESGTEQRFVLGDGAVINLYSRYETDRGQESLAQVNDSDSVSSGDEGEAASGVPDPAAATSGQKLIAGSETAYDKLLINDYALGLTQARRAFNVSTMFSILGGLVLIAGVSLAIFRADTGGQVAGAIITSSAGVLTSGLSQLFRGQSTKALKHLETQATELREDVRAQTNAANALRLLREVSDEDLRARLQAALILKFSGAALPDIGAHPKPRSHPNGSGNRNQEDIPTDQA